MFLLRLLIGLISVLHSCSDDYDLLRAYLQGDVMIGGLFPIHLETNISATTQVSCTEYDLPMFLRSQVMIYTIQEINQRTPRVLPGITLGYNIYDTCGSVSIAIRATLELLKNNTDDQSCFIPSNIHAALPEPQTKVVIGERTSEVSTAVARITALASLTQISYGSTSELLSQKFKFPTFLRTVPSDAVQTEGICELVRTFNWETVAIVGSDDEYGKYGSDRLQEHFDDMNICVEFVEILPGNFYLNNSSSQTTLQSVVQMLNKSKAEAIIMFTKDTNVEIIMEMAIKYKYNRTWIATDTWSTSPRIYNMPNIKLAGQVFGFIFKRNEVPGFKEHVLSMFNGTTNGILESHKSRYPLCSNTSKQNAGENCSMPCLDLVCLASSIDQDESYSIYLAVQVVVEALRSLLKCNEQSCERGANFTVSELLSEIQKVDFTLNNTHIKFTNGDPFLGYDIVEWTTSNSKQGIEIKPIGSYRPQKDITFSVDISGRINDKVSVFNCSKTCDPGSMRKSNGEKCCFHCFWCAEGEYSPGNGTECIRCDETAFSDEKRDRCLNKTQNFLQWTNPFSIILSFLAGVAIIVTLIVAAIFTIYHKTPVVKAVGGYLCFLELFSLLFCFCLVYTFLGKPSSNSCVGIPLFGIAFCLCISCILANLLQIMVAFNFEMNIGSWIKKLNQPVAIVIIGAGIQMALSVSWLVLKPPATHEELEPKAILYQCEMDPNGYFIAMLVYNAVLGFICFLFAFKGKQLPDLYKNASLIAVSMLLFMIIWTIFLPLFISLKGMYRPAISSAAILISSSSVLCCHLVPKCYIMIFRKELNNERAITEAIRKHYERKGVSVVQM